MQIRGAIAPLFVFLCGIAPCGIAVAQQPAPEPVQVQVPDQQPNAGPNADPRDNRRRPLTPQEQRELEIRQFDPLDRVDPNAAPGSNPDSTLDNKGAAREQQRKPELADAPVPGSIASSDRLNAASQRRGPTVTGDDDLNGAPQDYTGPAVLSRAYTVNRPMIAQDVKWSENFGFSLTFNSGTTGASLTPAGSIASSGNLYGTAFTAGLGGRKVFHRDQFGIRLATQYQQYYPSDGVYNGPNTNLSVDYTHVLSRRLSVTLTGTGSMFSQNYTLQNPVIEPDISIANINLASSPNIQIFDTSTKQFNAQADVTWQLSARLSLNFGVGYFAVIRDNPALLGTGGEQARGDLSYRWTKKTTVGVYYSYSYYQFQHGAGTSDANTLGLIYSYAFSRTLQLRFRGGGSQIESLGLTQVTLDPVIAALLGQTTGVIDAYQKTAATDISAQLVKDFSAGRTASISFVKGISPGNGLYQASEQESISVNFGAKLRRFYQFRISAGRDTLSSVSQTIGKYTSENAQISISRPFRRGFAANFQIGYRHFDIVSTTPVPGQYLISSGVTWSPPNGRLWPF